MVMKSGWRRGFYRIFISRWPWKVACGYIIHTCPLEVQRPLPACVQNVKMQNRGPVKHAVFEFALVLWFIVMAVRSNAA
jgi:hypothetical protein